MEKNLESLSKTDFSLKINLSVGAPSKIFFCFFCFRQTSYHFTAPFVQGSLVDVEVELTTNHRGYFTYRRVVYTVLYPKSFGLMSSWIDNFREPTTHWTITIMKYISRSKNTKSRLKHWFNILKGLKMTPIPKRTTKRGRFSVLQKYGFLVCPNISTVWCNQIGTVRKRTL